MVNVNHNKAVDTLLTQGGTVAVQDLEHESLSEAVKAEAGLFCTAYCDKARSTSAVLRAIANAVDYPHYFGSDFDALFDCLRETMMDQKKMLVLWFDKLHSGDPALTETAQKIEQICVDVAAYARQHNRVFAFVIEHAGKHPEPVIDPAPTEPSSD